MIESVQEYFKSDDAEEYVVDTVKRNIKEIMAEYGPPSNNSVSASVRDLMEQLIEKAKVHILEHMKNKDEIIDCVCNEVKRESKKKADICLKMDVMKQQQEEQNM